MKTYSEKQLEKLFDDIIGSEVVTRSSISKMFWEFKETQSVPQKASACVSLNVLIDIELDAEHIDHDTFLGVQLTDELNKCLDIDLSRSNFDGSDLIKFATVNSWTFDEVEDTDGIPDDEEDEDKD